ncbi:recombinase family protein [Falsihalocynthiibacter arcticus]|uniref:Resolvase n=1 Tax=Falsihalocynthiibacter arcticus TaxID=1579316 RepID=A0A126V0X3_9RHOB|nr:recombinase family protein [Falsihalocynthiibacter arcticus]AML51940.1 resolvase [Falsihalocynthiibacter arcticus]
MTTARLRAAIYARYSSDMQNAASIEDQIRLCRIHAEREGWEIVGSYEDRAISGASILRPGIQKLLRDAEEQGFDIVVSEALDRLSRNQADIAQLYQTLSFTGVGIETLSEGTVNEMHIGLKGTMNALFLKDLAAKTWRGLDGRVEKGKSAGGKSFGYDVVRSLREDGELNRGDLAINQDEAAVILRIFEAYRDGQSPGRIADLLNREGVIGPRTPNWNKSTIHGNPKRGTGILNNMLYVGERHWNRQAYKTDPRNGKRQSRPKEVSELRIVQVPDLRIVSQDLWEAVKARQKSQALKQSDSKAWQRRKPRFLFTGLIKCGCCGGGFSTIAKDRFGCSSSRNKGTSVCTNRTTVARKDMERQILDLLSGHLMEPDLVATFAKEYIAERNRLAASKTDTRATKQKELTKVIKDQDVLVNALLAGTPAARINDRMSQLEARQKQLEQDLASTPAPASNLRIHPQMAHTYHARIKTIVAELGEPNSESEARDEIRGLIDKITVTPLPTGGKRMQPQLELHGALANILALSLGVKGKPEQQITSCEQEVMQSIVFMVAGARLGHCLREISQTQIN